MPFEIGSQVGPYRIVSTLGAGGMGVVYRARDSRLNRDVAIKVSAAQFAERFEREARAVAALNHPNICTLHDVGPDYLVMELVEGRTLAELLADDAPSGRRMPTEKALSIAKQIASALDAAHERGIVHRDLKPGNIKITSDGTVKILDFGLARIDGVSDKLSTSSDDVTVSPGALATQAGTILGTAAYMAPEQARGLPIDRRVDIWAFGVVLYELLTGHRPFIAEDAAGTIAAVIQSEPKWDNVPADFQRLLKKCLQKDPKHRLRDIGDAWELHGSASSATPTPGRSGALGWTVAAVTAIVATIIIWSPWRAVEPASGVSGHHSIDLGASVVLPDLQYPSPSSFAVSPDGSKLVYQTGTPGGILYVKSLVPDAEPIGLVGTEDAENPYFSADGSRVLFGDTRWLKSASVQGGDVKQIAPLELNTGADWKNGQLIATSGVSGLLLVPPQGGNAKSILEYSDTEILSTPEILPGGNDALVSAYHFSKEGNFEATTTDVVSLRDKSRRVVLDKGHSARYINSGHLVYSNNGSLMAVRFDLGTLKSQGPHVAISNDVQHDINQVPQYSLTASGGIVYRPIENRAISASLVATSGIRTLSLASIPTMYAVSPDGTRLAYISRSESGNQDVYVSDANGRSTRITNGEALFLFPVWSPKGDYIVAGSLRKGLFLVRADGGGTVEQLVASKRVLRPMGFRPGETHLAYVDMTGAFTLFTVPMKRGTGLMRDGDPKAFLPPDSNQRSASFSPDGDWVVFETTENGHPILQARQFPDPGQKIAIAPDGRCPVWLKDEILYLSGGKIMSVRVAKQGPGLRIEKEKILRTDLTDVSWFSTDTNGATISVFQVSGHSPHVFRYLPNFADELRRRVR